MQETIKDVEKTRTVFRDLYNSLIVKVPKDAGDNFLA